MDIQVTLPLAMAVATAAIKYLSLGKVTGPLTVVVTLVLGLIAGLSHYQGLDPLTGLFYGFMTIGGMTAVDRIGTKSSGTTDTPKG